MCLTLYKQQTVEHCSAVIAHWNVHDHYNEHVERHVCWVVTHGVVTLPVAVLNV